ncbi:MAG: adenine deaminase [Endomicrobiales bacterium]
MGLLNRMKQTADVLLTGGKLVNVFSGEIYPENVAIRGEKIIGLGDYPARRTVPLNGKYICPGFIEGHIHVESSMAGVSEFARAVATAGTTSVIADPHEIANVLGLDGIKWILESAKHQPINLFLTLPSCVPATELETSGARLSSFTLYPYLSQQWVVGLGEMMDFPGVLAAKPEVLLKLKMGRAKHIDGHAPGLTGRELDAYIASGIRSEHESTTLREGREKLRKGMYLMIREGSATRNFDALLPLCTPENNRRIIFVSDDRHPHDLLKGHLNLLVRRAIRRGVDPVDAIRAVTLNPAECFSLRDLGAVAPGYEADIVVADDLKDFNVSMVFQRGELVARNGRYVGKRRGTRVPLRSSVNVKWLEKDDLHLAAQGKKAWVIELIRDQIITGKALLSPKVLDKRVVSDTGRDILKLVVVERHLASGNIGKGLVRGFGLKKGAIASSVAHDSHNIIAVGADDESLYHALVAVIKMGGGLAVTDGASVLGTLPLPVAGLMSERPLTELVSGLNELLRITKQLGTRVPDPFITLSFLALPVIPRLKLTDKGLVDVEKFKLVRLFR